MGAQEVAVGCLAGLDHYSGQYIPAIGNQIQRNAAQALLQVSARGYALPHIGSLPRVLRRFANERGEAEDDHRFG